MKEELYYTQMRNILYTIDDTTLRFCIFYSLIEMFQQSLFMPGQFSAYSYVRTYFSCLIHGRETPSNLFTLFSSNHLQQDTKIPTSLFPFQQTLLSTRSFDSIKQRLTPHYGPLSDEKPFDLTLRTSNFKRFPPLWSSGSTCVSKKVKVHFYKLFSPFPPLKIFIYLILLRTSPEYRNRTEESDRSVPLVNKGSKSRNGDGPQNVPTDDDLDYGCSSSRVGYLLRTTWDFTRNR